MTDNRPLSERMKEDRDKLLSQIDAWRLEARNSNASSAREIRSSIAAGEERLVEINDRIDELAAAEQREQNAARAWREMNPGGGTTTSNSGWSVTGEPDIYRDPMVDPSGPSFFRDMARAKAGDFEAQDRIRRSQVGRKEIRALGNTGGTGGSGGELAPPLWLVDQFIALARPGRIFADLAVKDTLPENVSSVNLPKILTGTTTAIQTTQNTALSQTDLTTGSVSSAIVTIGGKEVVSQQLIDQSGVPLDRVILADLAADYARQLDAQFIAGTGTSGQLRGVLNGASVGATTYTSASPAVVSSTSANSFVNRVIAAKVAIATNRYMPATAVVMHPRRWGWVQEALDGNGRPLITPQDARGDLNQPGADGAQVAQGAVGTLAGLPVYLDPSIPTNLGTGSNEDRVFVIRREDLYLYESELRLETFTQPYADSAGVLYRALGYAASLPDRFGPSVNVIAGTGLVAPTL